MKNHLAFVLFLFSSLLCNAQTNIEIASANVSFTFVNNNVDGMLSGFTSESVIDLDNIENSILKGAVKAETISTGNSIRNWSLRRSKYFDTDTYPTLNFESTSIKKEGDIIVVKGNLSIKDVSKEIIFRFERNDKKLVGKTTIYSSDYGIYIKDDRAENKVLVKLEFQLK